MRQAANRRCLIKDYALEFCGPKNEHINVGLERILPFCRKDLCPLDFVEPNLDRALALAMDLMAVPGPSCREGVIADAVREKLLAVGVPRAAIAVDDAHKRSPAGGETGNLIVKLPGTFRGPRRMLMAHLDTVPLCVGCVPERRGGYIESANPETGLGADNRSGVAAVLAAALEIFERRLPHPPVTLLFTVQEELGLYGSRFVRKSKLGRPAMAWNWDGRGPHRVTFAATGGEAIDIRVYGIASHAGGAPERGASAIAIASRAINALIENGWHGEVERGRRYGTCNFGTIRGGEATNVVPDFVEIKAECRSYDRRLRKRIVREIHRAFHSAAKSTRNHKGEHGRAEVVADTEYESFQLDKREECVRVAEAAIRSLALEPELLTTQSALDANWLNFHGIPTATLGAGQVLGHTKEECLDIAQFEQGCRVALRLAMGAGGNSRYAGANGK